MKKLLLFFFLAISSIYESEAACVLEGLNLPVRVKATGKPKVAKWGKVNKTLAAVSEILEGQDCVLKFEEIFTPSQQDSYFPAITNLIRIAPEESLKGISIYNRDGHLLGTFQNPVNFSKKGTYTYNYAYFQFRDPQGKLQSTGKQLIDMGSGEPKFILKWKEIHRQVLFPGKKSLK